jgi:hypothetical protein
MTQERMALGAALLVAAFAGGGLANLVSARLGAQSPPEIVTATQVNLVDRGGRLRGILSAEDERGMASLALLDPAGRPRALLAVTPDGAPTFELYDQGQALRVHATVQGEAPVVAVETGGGRRAILGGLTGSPALTFTDGAQNRAEVGLGGNGLPSLTMFGPTGQRQVSLLVDGDSQPLLTFRDDSGRSRASLGVVQGATVVNLADPARVRVVLGVAADGTATISFLDDAGRLVRTLPD